MGASVAAVFGGGGLFGIAFGLGVGEAFADHGVRLGDVPTVGTSAGTWVAAHLHFGVRFADSLAEIGGRVPRTPDLRPGRLYSIASDLFGADALVPNLTGVACTFPRLSRRMLDAGRVPVADVVAASSAVPGMLAPHRIDGCLYVDGGVRSMASADVADCEVDRLLVVLPLSGPLFGPAGRLLERRTLREVARWRERSSAPELVLVRPSRRIAGLVSRPDQLFCPRVAEACFELAYAVTVERVLPGWQVASGVAA